MTGPRLSVRTRHRRDGAVVLTIRSPGAGKLFVLARSGKPLRTVATVTRNADAKGRATAILRVRGRSLARLRAARKLATTIRVRFVPKDPLARALSRLVTTSFRYGAAKRTTARPAR